MKNFKLILKSLINNNACIEGGRSKRWWFAIIMVTISLVLTLIPNVVATINKQGDEFVNGSTNNYENGVLRFTEEINKKGLAMTVRLDETRGVKYLQVERKVEDKTLQGNEAWASAFPNVNSQGLHCYSHLNDEGKIDFQAFFMEENYIEAENWNKITKEVSYSVDEEGKEVETQYDRNSSFIVFGVDNCISYLYKSNGTTTNSMKFNGDYRFFDEGYSINDFEKFTYKDVVVYSTGADALATGNPDVYEAYRTHSWETWKDFFRTSNFTYKLTNIWQSNLITFGINVGIIFFMGLMLFILARGKANPYRVYNFWETQKMVYWATISPAVIAMVVGFIFSNFAMYAFPLLLGVRIMWLSMKSLNPQSGAPVYPKPQKVVKEVKAKTVKAKKAK